MPFLSPNPSPQSFPKNLYVNICVKYSLTYAVLFVKLKKIFNNIVRPLAKAKGYTAAATNDEGI